VAAASRDPGRLDGVLREGAAIVLERAAPGRRRTAYTVTRVRRGRRWVSLVPALANRIVETACARGGPAGLRGARIAGREVRRGGSRLDFVLRHRGRDVLVEVKSATWVRGGRALFPDAPTARGARHVRELTAAARRGEAAALVFVVQRSGARVFSPHPGRDPEFAAALRAAAAAGVRVLAFTCRVSRGGVSLDRRIPVDLEWP
jgi:sugar fermentation stimulation protein A